MNLIRNIIAYPSELTDMRLDLRTPYNEPYMLVCFDYTQEPETDKRIIRVVEKRFDDVDFEDMKIKSVRETLTRKHTITTSFKPKLSLS